MYSGIVKFYNGIKGFGFITPDDGSKDVFIHMSTLEKAGVSDLAEGQKVSFDMTQDMRGRSAASNLKLV